MACQWNVVLKWTTSRWNFQRIPPCWEIPNGPCMTFLFSPPSAWHSNDFICKRQAPEMCLHMFIIFISLHILAPRGKIKKRFPSRKLIWLTGKSAFKNRRYNNSNWLFVRHCHIHFGGKSHPENSQQVAPTDLTRHVAIKTEIANVLFLHENNRWNRWSMRCSPINLEA